MGAVSVRLRWLLRRHWVATIGFALAAGLAGGLSLAAWDAARRTDRVFDHFLAATDSPELDVTFCPPGVTSIQEADVNACLQYDQVAERDVVRGLPEVAGADRAAVRTGVMARASHPGTPAEQVVFLSAMLDPGMPTPLGRPIVVAGRLAPADAPDEVMVNEAFLGQYDVGLGDRLRLQAFATGESEQTPADQRRSPAVEARIVGVVRTLQDLSAANDGGQAKVSATIFTRPGLDRRMAHAAAFYSAIRVQARDGDATRARAAIDRAFPGRPVNNQYSTSADDEVPVRDAYHYEARAALAVAVLTALAALVFVGQALARQVRREWADAGVLRSIGLSPRQAALAAAGRGVIIGAGAAVVAAAIAIGCSPVGPIGQARHTALDRGLHVDPVVLGIGLPILLLVVVFVSAVPAWRLAAAHRWRHRGRPLRRLPTSGLSPPMAAGLGMAANGGRDGVSLPVGTAMAGVVLASSVLVVAPGLVASLHHLVSTPAGYGVTWDRSISGLQAGEPPGVREHLRTLGGVERTAAMYGTELVVGTESLWAVALEPVDETTPAVAPTITRGREPLRASEIALGELTLRRLGAQLGDEVPVAASVAGATPQPHTIVGTAVINATDEGSPGLGAVLSPEGIRRVAPGTVPSIFVVDLAGGEPGRAAEADLAATYGAQLSGPVQQPAVRNLDRLRAVPWVLAAIVAAFAAGSLAHALLLLVRR
ncbi:MAG TPA: FtsX-like permease family protein, partial [Acidimicrobiales bacterium]